MSGSQSGCPLWTSAFRWTQYAIYTGAPWMSGIEQFVWLAWSLYPLSNTCFAGLTSLLGAWRTPLSECIFCDCGTCLVCTWLPTLKWPCVKSYLVEGWINIQLQMSNINVNFKERGEGVHEWSICYKLLQLFKEICFGIKKKTPKFVL